MRLLHPSTPPIAMLHAVSDLPHESFEDWCISRSTFTRLLDVLEEGGFGTTHFSALTENGKPAEKAAILTFDDCYRHLFDFAIPELLKRKMTAAFYMPTAHIGSYNVWDEAKGAPRMELMTIAELKELIRLGMEVGAHGHRHRQLAPLAGTPALHEELSLSKKSLEAITGRPVYSFAYPYGSVPRGYRSALGAAGYKYGLSIYQPFESKLALRRFGVYEKDTPAALAKKLSSPYRWMRKVYDAVKRN